MWNKALDQALARLFRIGALEVTYPDGTRRRYGEPGADPVRVTIRDETLPRRLLLTPDMALGEAYMNEQLTLDDDDLRGLLLLALTNRRRGHDPGIMRATGRALTPVQRWLSHNWRAGSKRNVQHHYDLSGALYDLFLDEDRQYSCAYFPEPDMSLEAAQEAKKRHIARKLLIEPGDRVLDIGCGWGGMALTLARDFGARVVGVTLSEEQHRIARERVAQAQLSDRIDIRLQDYREVEGPFERIVSVGMFEHVGATHFREYFAKVAELLSPKGVALIHTIGSSSPPRSTSPWIRKYIFPGGYLPSMSEATRAIEFADLTITDVEVWRMHYAHTLRHWHDRFMANVDKARDLYDERFCRMWRYYLTASEVSFIAERLGNFQFQLSHDKTAVPITRDYLYAD
ncbi:Cfa, cyclopropane-fatty-acyl-phospholipid synthase [Oceanicola granulosus HTCC2516]|uniref:Cfa, cyclopropane-fatty-acyl-phospholipid synthase n=1 Tax=Oceanicola granulosus (strain ATCC BAA-861 / DSM 15982 / KCTC 12143 / HTCC2516) TaxID=314256 RepID=Q2CA46_OCEGH|nr:cyclopropane-fatty-acyl-phospholipid synthase family protein [Oceanicola granulosus]EAR49543.1 Cfa, cyclopropane-fatty-acyl-phospholipid synthase [Oceanicola granulosus HTCC2516]